MDGQTKGSVELTSGNTFTWERLIAGSRGGVHGQFQTPPTPQDTEEAVAIVEAMIPKAQGVVGAVALSNDVNSHQVRALLDQHVLQGRSRN